MKSVTYKEIVDAISNIIWDRPKIVFVHSSVASFGEMEGSFETCLKAWMNSMSPDMTLLMPTFTLSFCKNGIFDSARTPSEVGVLTEAFRLYPDVLRSRHPIYSVAARGPRSVEIGQILGETCMGKGSVFEFLEQENALIVGFGVPLYSAGTILHRPEELQRVPYRYWKTFNGKYFTDQGSKSCVVKFWARRLDLGADNDFPPVIERLQREGLLRSIPLGSSKVEAAYAQDICRVETAMLQEDPLAVAADRENLHKKLSKVSVAFLGSSNLDLLSQTLEEVYASWDSNGLRTIPVPFGQYRPLLLKEDSDLYIADPHFVVFLERLEDLCGEAMVDPYGPGMLTFQRNLEDYLSAIQRARHKLNGFFIVATFAPSSRSVLTSADGLSSEGFQAMAEYGNRRLAEVVKGIEAACILDLSSVLMKSGLKARDRKYWYIGRIPFGQETQNTIARRLAGICLARQGKSARMLVIDLDNTLWGGVVGEEGLEGIRVGGDYPGNAYRDFQRVLKFLKERGVILAIASKNTETIALEAIDLHPEMVLARDDFTLWRINWQDKANNIRSICDEIGLSPATVCFLDDNPRERAWVKSQIPDMYVPDLPEDPGERPQFLLELPCLETVELTAEDRHRADQYRAEQNLKVQRQTYENIEDFYRSLNMVMTPCAYSRTNKARILQLIAKTNQFNTTTKRYSETELGKLISVEGQVFAIKLKDLFRQEEIIGVLILEWQPGVCRIDSFLLSCRVLGYGVETAVLAWLSQMAQARSVERLVGTIVETPRNQVVRSLYLDHGFKAIEKGEFELLLSSSRIECPAWICLETDLVETGVLDEG